MGHASRERRQGEAWTGVRKFHRPAESRAMKKGDRAFFYHSNEGKEIVGIAEIIKEAYPDPTDKTGNSSASTSRPTSR